MYRFYFGLYVRKDKCTFSQHFDPKDGKQCTRHIVCKPTWNNCCGKAKQCCNTHADNTNKVISSLLSLESTPYAVVLLCFHRSLQAYDSSQGWQVFPVVPWKNKSSAVAQMGDRGHNRHWPKRGGAVPLSRSAGNPSNTMWPAPWSTSVPSGVFIHPAVWHNSVGCHSSRRNISTNYYLVVEMHTVTVRSDDARYLLN